MLGLNSNQEQSIEDILKIAQLRFEKCELKEARDLFAYALEKAKENKRPKEIAESIIGLIFCAGEALDLSTMDYWQKELHEIMALFPEQVPPAVWYCKGAIAVRQNEWLLAQRYFHRFLKLSRLELATQPGKEREYKRQELRALNMLSMCMQERGCLRRSEWLANVTLRASEAEKFAEITGYAYLILGKAAEARKDLEQALHFYQKSHAHFLSVHHWYYHLYIVYGYARIARKMQNYPQAMFYLDLVYRAANGPEFGALRRRVEQEKNKIEQDTVDLLIDSQSGMIQTREKGKISLRKQYVLLDILKALSDAHAKPELIDESRGLSKAEIINDVWHEQYRPEAHDNKLYYNINRLRKLIEPNARQPKYLLNWKEGYRLAPGLKVRLMEAQKIKHPAERQKVTEQ